MPFVQVKLIENVFTPEQKQQLITKITDAFIEVEGEHMRPVTFVVIDETRSGDWGIGGKAMTTQAVRALAPAKKSVACGRFCRCPVQIPWTGFFANTLSKSRFHGGCRTGRKFVSRPSSPTLF